MGAPALCSPRRATSLCGTLTNSRLGPFVTEKLHEPAKLNSGRKLSYSRGLFADTIRGNKFWWHGGSADGYKSVLGRFPEQGLSIAIMCSSGDDTNTTTFARRIFELYVPATGAQDVGNTAPPIAAEGVDVAGLNLNSRAGLFFKRGLTGQFELKTMDGKTTRYRRAQSYAPTADDLKAFAGRYESTEIGTVFLIEPRGDGLLVRLEHNPSRSPELKPVDRDTFQISRVTVRFHRDKSGKVVALDYSNPLIRSVKFTRLNERKITAEAQRAQRKTQRSNS